MAFHFLGPVSEKVLASSASLPPQALGQHLRIHTQQQGLPNLAQASVALLGVLEYRDAPAQHPKPFDVNAVRLQLYRLMRGNWHTTVLDLGDVAAGNTLADTYFAVTAIVAELLVQNIVPIVIGTSQHLTYATYRAFDSIHNKTHLVAIDHRFDFGQGSTLIAPHSYMSKMITETPTHLFTFTNLGYQSYFVAQEELDLMERLFFEAYRLGSLTANLALAEPILRDAHLVSVDLRAIRAAEMGLHPHFSPNGFTGREICTLARYAGLSDNVSLLGLYEARPTPQACQTIAQLIWYFIEGLNFRIPEHPNTESQDFTKFTVPTELATLVFYKSQVTQRWWVVVPSSTEADAPTLLPCTEADYVAACQQQLPERWSKAYKIRDT